MLLFVRAQREGLTAKDVAQRLSIPVTVARWRLERLADAGFVQTAFERRSRGRPAKIYSAAPETAQIEFPARRYERLVSLLMRNRDLHEVGSKFGAELAESAGLRPGAGLDALCRELGKLGFQASRAGDELVSATCPLRPIVVADTDASAIDEGMWSALVETAVGASGAKCSTHDCFDRSRPCRIAISP